MKEELFKKIVEDHYFKIYRICYRYFGDADEARDACQETFLKIWLNLGKFRGDSSPATWACRIAINVCLTSIRTNKKLKACIIQENNVNSYDCISDETDDRQEEEAKLQFFNHFLNSLSSADRTLVALYLEEMDSREISSITGLSEANVRTRIHRIKNEIKNRWEEKNGTG